MPDIIGQALAQPGLGWMILALLGAGLVRGFTGFGTALIFVPVAGQFLPAADVILVMATTGLVSMLALVPGAWRVADRGEVAILALAAAITVPVGIWLLVRTDALTIRWIVAAVALVTLVAVATGWRWQGRLGWPGLSAVGAASGMVGGMTGLTGPVVIMFYLANARSAQAVRANTILFLASLDVVLVVNLGLAGQIRPEILALGGVMMLPYLAATLVGQALFDPAHEKAYRYAAYAVISLALISGLPLLDRGA